MTKSQRGKIILVASIFNWPPRSGIHVLVIFLTPFAVTYIRHETLL